MASCTTCRAIQCGLTSYPSNFTAKFHWSGESWAKRSRSAVASRSIPANAILTSIRRGSGSNRDDGDSGEPTRGWQCERHEFRTRRTRGASTDLELQWLFQGSFANTTGYFGRAFDLLSMMSIQLPTPTLRSADGGFGASEEGPSFSKLSSRHLHLAGPTSGIGPQPRRPWPELDTSGCNVS